MKAKYQVSSQFVSRNTLILVLLVTICCNGGESAPLTQSESTAVTPSKSFPNEYYSNHAEHYCSTWKSICTGDAQCTIFEPNDVETNPSYCICANKNEYPLKNSLSYETKCMPVTDENHKCDKTTLTCPPEAECYKSINKAGEVDRSVCRCKMGFWIFEIQEKTISDRKYACLEPNNCQPGDCPSGYICQSSTQDPSITTCVLQKGTDECIPFIGCPKGHMCLRLKVNTPRKCYDVASEIGHAIDIPDIWKTKDDDENSDEKHDINSKTDPLSDTPKSSLDSDKKIDDEITDTTNKLKTKSEIGSEGLKGTSPVTDSSSAETTESSLDSDKNVDDGFSSDPAPKGNKLDVVSKGNQDSSPAAGPSLDDETKKLVSGTQKKVDGDSKDSKENPASPKSKKEA